MDNKKIKIKEIFTSIQGEGPYIGEKHLFVRTTKCNLNCSYCDTDFRCDENSKEYNYDEFFEELKSYDANVVSFTGGEPLLQADFIAEKLHFFTFLMMNHSCISGNSIVRYRVFVLSFLHI